MNTVWGQYSLEISERESLLAYFRRSGFGFRTPILSNKVRVRSVVVEQNRRCEAPPPWSNTLPLTAFDQTLFWEHANLLRVFSGVPEDLGEVGGLTCSRSSRFGIATRYGYSSVGMTIVRRSDRL